MSQSYPSKYHQIISSVEDTHFWFRGRRDMVRAVIHHFFPRPKGKTFLEVGFGTGELLSVIESLGFQTYGVDINEATRQFTRSKNRATIFIQSFLSFTHTPFHAIGIFDVVEHQKDDVQFLRRAHDLLAPNGLLFVTVPAGQWLWSDVDRLSGHVRRYAKRELIDALQASGFTVLWCQYWNATLLPWYVLWKLYCLVFGKSNPAQFVSQMNPVLNKLFFYIITIENQLLLRIPFLIGTSLVVVARKKAI